MYPGANQNDPLQWTVFPMLFPPPPRPSPGGRPALPRFLLLALAAIAGLRVEADSPARPKSRPYLTTIGPPPVRSEEPPPPRDYQVRPAGGPPVPAAAPEIAEVAEANRAASASTPPFPLPSAAQEPPAAAPVSGPVPRPAPPIIPDDTRPPVRPEDFLPFFQLPVPGGDATAVIPASASAPAPAPGQPSRATYRQH